jgi:hypothetical protein
VGELCQSELGYILNTLFIPPPTSSLLKRAQGYDTLFLPQQVPFALFPDLTLETAQFGRASEGAFTIM